MVRTRKSALVMASILAVPAAACAQVPDLLNAFDAGGRSMGAGGSLNVTDASTLSSYYNPASLGYLDRREISASYRNLPASSGTTGKRFEAQSSSGKRGDQGLTHLGYAAPVRELLGHGDGTIAFSYTIGGFMDDETRGSSSGFTDAGVLYQNYFLHREAQSNFYTLAYGRTNAAQTLSLGAGLTYVDQSVSVAENADASIGGSPVDVNRKLSSNGNGFGILLGAQYVPPKAPNVSFGLSYRSEINLQNNGDTSSFLDKIPARLLFGASYRRDGLRGGDDFLVFGAQIQHFFSADNGVGFDRDAQTTFGFGAEYNYAFPNFRIPVRLGYIEVPTGGTGFTRRNAFTYGLGYRPLSGNYGIDLSWAAPQGGGYDFGITGSYRF